MSLILKGRDSGFGWMFLCSTVIHLAFFFILVEFHFSPLPHPEGPVYYVDVVNLPVANPQAGTPSPPGGAAAVTRPKREEMVVPARVPQKSAPKTKPSVEKKPASPAETAQQFEERMAKIEQEVAGKHESQAVEAIRQRMAGAGKGGQVGVPGGKGTEAGSDYAGYIRSRLTDAFRTTIAFQTKNPEVMVRLTIDRNGRVAGVKLERSSGDRIFEDAVLRTIAKAEQNFPPPPGGKRFEYSFRFAPEGVSKK